MSSSVVNPAESPRSFWSTIAEAIRGSHQDFTEAPVGRAVILLSVPMVLEMLMESVFAVVDIFFVGHLGAEAVATVGITESLMTLVYAVAIGLSIGAAATVARRIGEKDPDRVVRAAMQSSGLGLLLAAPVERHRGHLDGVTTFRVDPQRGGHERLDVGEVDAGQRAGVDDDADVQALHVAGGGLTLLDGRVHRV